MYELYTIGHLTQFTGLTDRTIRSHIASGFLEGEKINGIWHFTPEQTDSYLRHPAVRPSILAKNNALVWDFMLDNRKTERQVCIILDLPGDDEKEAMEFFCYAISNGTFSQLRFSFDSYGPTPRVILTGHSEQILELVNQYHSHRKPRN